MKKVTFVILCLEGALLSFNVAAASALIPSISADFSVSQIVAGRIVWLYMLPYGIAALFYGPLARTFDVKKIELIALLFFSLSNLLAGLSQNINTLFLARFLMGIFGASVTPLVLILIAHHTTEENRGRCVGSFFSITFIASLLGLFLSGIIHWRLIFIIPAICGFLLWIAIYIKLPSFKGEAASFKINYLPALKNKTVFSIFTYIFFVSIFFHGVQQWLSVYFSLEFNFSQFLISMLITLTSLSGIFGEFIGGHLSDTKGRFKTIEWGIICMIFSVFLLIFKFPVFILALLMLIWGLGWTFNHAGLSTRLTDLPKEFLNEAASLNSSVRFLAGGLGVTLGSITIQKGFNLHFIVFGAALIMLAFSARALLFSK
ncbi:MAG: MFS transporter [Candidatus Omnitrophota bacterium]|nr:MFS transporter [Candidatus Omnitrophota bacterium]